MKYYYGNDYKEAVGNDPVEIKTTEQLEQYKEAYAFVLPEEQVNGLEEEIDERNDAFWSEIVDVFERTNEDGTQWVDEDDWEEAAQAIVEFNDGDYDESLADAALIHWIEGDDSGYVPEEVEEVIRTLCESWK